LAPVIVVPAHFFLRDAAIKTLDATSVTFDLGSTLTSYDWTYVSGPISGDPTETTDYAAELPGGVVGESSSGEYVYRLSVTDSEGFTGTADSSVVVNTSPAVTITAPETQYHKIGTEVVTTVTVEDVDESGYVLSWDWVSYPDLVEPEIVVSGDSLTATFVAGASTGDGTNYVLRCTATDLEEAISTNDTVTYYASSPSIVITSPAAILKTVSSEVSAAITVDSGLTLASTLWEQVSGPTAVIDDPTSATINITVATISTVILSCTVTDSYGIETTETCSIIVTVTPSVNIGEPFHIIGTGSVFSTTAANDEPDSGAVTMVWEFLDYPGVSAPDITLSNGDLTASFTAVDPSDEDHQYELQCTMTNAYSFSDSSYIIVQAGDAPEVTVSTNAVGVINESQEVSAAIVITPGESVETILWEVTSGDPVTWVDATVNPAYFTAATYGPRTIKCTVTDTFGAYSYDTETTTIAGPPVISFGATYQPGVLDEVYSRSMTITAPYGTVDTVEFSWLGGPDAPEITYPSTVILEGYAFDFTPTTYTSGPGQIDENPYIIQCIVTTSYGLSAGNQQNIYAGDRPAISDVSVALQDADDITSTPGSIPTYGDTFYPYSRSDNPIAVVATASASHVGQGLLYHWYVNGVLLAESGTAREVLEGDGASVSFSSTANGLYTIELRVEDDYIGLTNDLVADVHKFTMRSATRPTVADQDIPACEIDIVKSITASVSDVDALVPGSLGSTISSYLWEWVSYPQVNPESPAPTLAGSTTTTVSVTRTLFTEAVPESLNRY
jgi:hypothetical protein